MSTICRDCARRGARAAGLLPEGVRTVRDRGAPMIDHDLNCASHGPDGALCQKIRGHVGNHGGVDARGNWRDWLGGDA